MLKAITRSRSVFKLWCIKLNKFKSNGYNGTHLLVLGKARAAHHGKRFTWSTLELNSKINRKPFINGWRHQWNDFDYFFPVKRKTEPNCLACLFIWAFLVVSPRPRMSSNIKGAEPPFDGQFNSTPGCTNSRTRNVSAARRNRRRAALTEMWWTVNPPFPHKL